MSVCPSVHPSVYKISKTFEKSIVSIHFLPSSYPYRFEYHDPYTLSFSWPHFGPSGGKIFSQKVRFLKLLKELLSQFLHTWHLRLCGVLLDPGHDMFLPSLSVL